MLAPYEQDLWFHQATEEEIETALEAHAFNTQMEKTMDIAKLYEILGETTVQLRKGDVIHGSPALVEAIGRGDEDLPGGVVTIDAMPHADEASSGLEKVDLCFLWIGVDKAKAEARRADLIAILNDWPNAAELAGGPSYIAVGATIGDQGAAFQLFALGKALGLWSIITPASFGMTGDEAKQAAGMGYIMISGYRRSGTAERAA